MKTLYAVMVLAWWLPAVTLADAPPEVPQLMAQLFEHYARLSADLVAPEKFADPTRAARIRQELTGLDQAARQAVEQHRLNSPTMRLSRQVLREQFVQAVQLFDAGQKEYARRVLNGALTVCMSCHTQLPEARKPFAKLPEPMVFTTPFEQAELLFVLRDYDHALPIYGRLVAGYPNNGLSEPRVTIALRRRMAIFARIRRDPAGGMSALQQDLQNPWLSNDLHDAGLAWIAEFRDWRRERPFNLLTANDHSIIDFAQRTLAPVSGQPVIGIDQRRLIRFLRVSGVLYDYLFAHPQTRVAQRLLYWLAICDRALNDSFFYSLADRYLVECIRRDPTQPVAAQCYDAYEAATIQAYSGSSGTHLPVEVEKQLRDLQRLIGGATPRSAARSRSGKAAPSTELRP